jgi:hypothetical protein
VGASDHLTIVTTNYDLLLDTILSDILGERGEPDVSRIDAGFVYRGVGGGHLASRPGIRNGADAGSEGSITSRLALYKLHGSLNYLRCEVCDQVYLNPKGDVADLSFDRQPKDANTCHCGHGPLRHMIVAPSTARSVRIPQILEIWSAAMEALRMGQEWVFIGYSLPPEDLAIRSMLLRAWYARGQNEVEGKNIAEWPFKPHPSIEVIQKGDGSASSYKLLFPELTYCGDGLEGWLDHGLRKIAFVDQQTTS